MKMNGNSISCISYIKYYSTGRIKEAGCQDYYGSQSTTLGIVSQFDETDDLISLTYCHPDKFGKDYKIVRACNRLSKVIYEKIYNNDALYEVELNKIPD